MREDRPEGWVEGEMTGADEGEDNWRLDLPFENMFDGRVFISLVISKI